MNFCDWLLTYCPDVIVVDVKSDELSELSYVVEGHNEITIFSPNY